MSDRYRPRERSPQDRYCALRDDHARRDDRSRQDDRYRRDDRTTRHVDRDEDRHYNPRDDRYQPSDDRYRPNDPDTRDYESRRYTRPASRPIRNDYRDNQPDRYRPSSRDRSTRSDPRSVSAQTVPCLSIRRPNPDDIRLNKNPQGPSLQNLPRNAQEVLKQRRTYVESRYKGSVTLTDKVLRGQLTTDTSLNTLLLEAQWMPFAAYHLLDTLRHRDASARSTNRHIEPDAVFAAFRDPPCSSDPDRIRSACATLRDRHRDESNIAVYKSMVLDNLVVAVRKLNAELLELGFGGILKVLQEPLVQDARQPILHTSISRDDTLPRVLEPNSNGSSVGIITTSTPPVLSQQPDPVKPVVLHDTNHALSRATAHMSLEVTASAISAPIMQSDPVKPVVARGAKHAMPRGSTDDDHIRRVVQKGTSSLDQMSTANLESLAVDFARYLNSSRHSQPARVREFIGSIVRWDRLDDVENMALSIDLVLARRRSHFAHDTLVSSGSDDEQCGDESLFDAAMGTGDDTVTSWSSLGEATISNDTSNIELEVDDGAAGMEVDEDAAGVEVDDDAARVEVDDDAIALSNSDDLDDSPPLQIGEPVNLSALIDLVARSHGSQTMLQDTLVSLLDVLCFLSPKMTECSGLRVGSGGWFTDATICLAINLIRALPDTVLGISLDERSRLDRVHFCPELIYYMTSSNGLSGDAYEQSWRTRQIGRKILQVIDSKKSQTILSPYHRNDHWYAIEVPLSSPTVTTINVFDSANPNRTSDTRGRIAVQLVDVFRKLAASSKVWNGTLFDNSSVRFVACEQQRDSFNCAIFTLKNLFGRACYGDSSRTTIPYLDAEPDVIRLRLLRLVADAIDARCGLEKHRLRHPLDIIYDYFAYLSQVEHIPSAAKAEQISAVATSGTGTEHRPLELDIAEAEAIHADGVEIHEKDTQVSHPLVLPVSDEALNTVHAGVVHPFIEPLVLAVQPDTTAADTLPKHAPVAQSLKHGDAVDGSVMERAMKIVTSMPSLEKLLTGDFTEEDAAAVMRQWDKFNKGVLQVKHDAAFTTEQRQLIKCAGIVYKKLGGTFSAKMNDRIKSELRHAENKLTWLDVSGGLSTAPSDAVPDVVDDDEAPVRIAGHLTRRQMPNRSTSSKESLQADLPADPAGTNQLRKRKSTAPGTSTSKKPRVDISEAAGTPTALPTVESVSTRRSTRLRHPPALPYGEVATPALQDDDTGGDGRDDIDYNDDIDAEIETLRKKPAKKPKKTKR